MLFSHNMTEDLSIFLCIFLFMCSIFSSYVASYIKSQGIYLLRLHLSYLINTSLPTLSLLALAWYVFLHPLSKWRSMISFTYSFFNSYQSDVLFYQRVLAYIFLCLRLDLFLLYHWPLAQWPSPTLVPQSSTLAVAPRPPPVCSVLCPQVCTSLDSMPPFS